MDKPKNYGYYQNSRNKIPYKEWPQEVKDYKNWQRRNRMNPKWKHLSEEDRKIEREKVIAENRKVWYEKYNDMTEEEKAEVNKKKGNFWNLASDEKKEEMRDNLSQRSNDFWNSMTEEEHKEFGRYRWNLKSDEEKEIIKDRFLKGGKDYRENLSEEDIKLQIKRLNDSHLKKLEDPEFREKNREQLKDARLKFMETLTEEKRKEIGERSKEYWKNMSPEEREKRSEDRTRRNNEWWASRTPEQRLEISNRTRTWWENLSNEDKESWYKRRSEGQRASNLRLKDTEIDFMNRLNLLSWNDPYLDYQYQYTSQIKHPDFDQVFPSNPVTGSTFINPFHKWDFIIFTNRGCVLCDIDGSMHALGEGDFVVNGIDIGLYIQFNDSQRPYQTDGMDAYVILAYNDKLTNDTPVLSFQTGKTMTYKEFIALLTLLPPKKELKKLLKK